MRKIPGQMGLFGEPSQTQRGAAVGPAHVSPELQSIAERLPRKIRLGTSSWSFPGWKEIVYDRDVPTAKLSRQGLEAYAQHPLLRTVGIDRTFYAPITAEAFAAYAAMVPEDFRFLVKASSLCTREDSDLFLDPAFATEQVVGPFVEGLKRKTGPLVFQFSPMGSPFVGNPARFAARLGEFLASLPRGPRYAVELRNRQLLCPEYFEALAEAGAHHCLGVHPSMPPPGEQQCRSGPLVVRWMLHGGLAYKQAKERYEPFTELVDEDVPTRDSLADLCLEQALLGHEVIVVANNKAEGSAPLTAFKLAASIVRRMEERGAS